MGGDVDGDPEVPTARCFPPLAELTKSRLDDPTTDLQDVASLLG
jgi:hypothetical protein